MDCPRCDGSLSVYVAERPGTAAVVCDACGFADVSASHTADGGENESWDQALERFNTSKFADQRLCQTTRGETVSIPSAEPANDVTESTQFADSVVIVSSIGEDVTNFDRSDDMDAEEEKSPVQSD